MALARRARKDRPDYWPGFVDVLSTLLLVFIFMLSVFMLAQFFMTREIAGKDSALTKLNRQITELTELLSLERGALQTKNEQVLALTASLAQTQDEQKKAQDQLDNLQNHSQNREKRDEARISAQAIAQVEFLNKQIAALRAQLAAVETALQATQARDSEQQIKIADLGRRLNVALAQKVQELSKYRSDFFGRLRDILSNRPDIRIQGDRFVFQSELFFASGDAELKADGKAELDKLAAALMELEQKIPAQLAWVLRVDGHTDRRPIATSAFASNWHLSSARAIRVVQYLVERGVAPQHLVAAGFGEFQPIDAQDTGEAYSRNRRIELKLTDR